MKNREIANRIAELHYPNEPNVIHDQKYRLVRMKTLADQVESELNLLTIPVVVSSCVDKDTLIKDLDDKRIVGTTLNNDMWHYCRKETAEHLLDKYEIIPK